MLRARFESNPSDPSSWRCAVARGSYEGVLKPIGGSTWLSPDEAQAIDELSAASKALAVLGAKGGAFLFSLSLSLSLSLSRTYAHSHHYK